MTYRLFLDDERNPVDDETDDWVVARSFSQAVEIMDTYDCPYFVSFDHDLGEEKSGVDVARWMINRDMDRGGSWIPEDFNWYTHSQNPVGTKNIDYLIEGYMGYEH